MKTLVIMAAGLGSRYGGVKQMEGVGPNNEILLEYAMYDAIQAGFEKFVLIIKPGMLADCKERFGDRIEKSKGVKICYAFQTLDGYEGLSFPEGRTKPMGTTHAVLCAKEFLTEPYGVLNADDYYGRDAFFTIGDALASLDSGDKTCMVAYKLKNTVSDFGSVTRGVCSSTNGMLDKVKETYKITVMPDGRICDCAAEGVETELDPDCLVSMNFWGYSDKLTPIMDKYFRDFLANIENEDKGAMKAECLLPTMMDKLITGGDVSCKVLSSGDKWFGLTYKEDRPGVVKMVKALHDSGYYPEKLW